MKIEYQQIQEIRKHSHSGKQEVLLRELYALNACEPIWDLKKFKEIGGTLTDSPAVLDVCLRGVHVNPNGTKGWTVIPGHFIIKRSLHRKDYRWDSVIVNADMIDTALKVYEKKLSKDEVHFVYLYDDCYFDFYLLDLLKRREDGVLVSDSCRVRNPDNGNQPGLERVYKLQYNWGFERQYHCTTKEERDEIYRYHKNPVTQSDLDRLNAIPLGEEVKEEPGVIFAPYIPTLVDDLVGNYNPKCTSPYF